MKKRINSYYFCYFIIILGLFIPEMIFKLINSSSIISLSTLRILASSSLIASIFAFILSFANKYIRNIISFLIIFASSVYGSVQLGFDNFLGVYMSVQTSSQFGAVKDYISDFIRSFEPIYFTCLIPFVVLIILSIVFRKRIDNARLSLRKRLVSSISIIVFSLSIFIVSIFMPLLQNKGQAISTMDLFRTASNPSLTVEQYGSTMFCFLDFKQMLFPEVIEEEFEVNKEVKSNINEFTRVIDDTAWDNIIANESNNTLNSLNKYFISRSITDKNEYTGLFEDKNLIVIMMESVNDIFINPDLYPNFYKMVTEGWYWENNYSPRNSCATMNNEFSGMTSLYSIYNTCTASKYRSNEYYESLFNLFNNDDYVTFSAHNYTQAYYPRKTIHTNMGSKEYFGAEKLKIKYSNEYINWAYDDEFMEKILGIIDNKTENNEHFMTWLTTVSSHQPYSTSSIQGDGHLNITKGTKYPMDVRRYMSKLKYLDDGLGILLEGLEKRNILDDTVIVLYGDHYPYGLSTKNINKVLDYDTSEYKNAERVPFVIYNSTIEPKVYSEYTSYINILPTLSNLFNLDYDPRLYLGTDLLSKDYKSITVFADGSWKNEIAFYNAAKDKITYFTDQEYSEEEIIAINKDIKNKINVSSKVITNNYFNYLDKALKKEKDKATTTTTTSTTKVN